MKQTLLSIKRTTTVTTQAIAGLAKLEIAAVYTVEIGGCTSWELARKVVRAFNQLSGMQVRVDDIVFTPLHALNALKGDAIAPVSGNRSVGGNTRISLYPQTIQRQH